MSAAGSASCDAGSIASVPFCVMTDAGDRLRRGILERNIFRGLLVLDVGHTLQ